MPPPSRPPPPRESPLPTPRLLVFDLDGTLIDSRLDLCNSVNAMLSQLGKPALPEAVIASYIGDGASMLVRRALGDPEGDPEDDSETPEARHHEAAVHHALHLFLDFYRIHKLDNTYVYPGVLASLALIRERHPTLPMAVLTNKPVAPSRDICAHFGLDRFFFQNYGGNSFPTKKPDAHGLLALMAEASAHSPYPARPPIAPADTVMIGDSDVDILTARNCGARSLGCTFGLSPHTLAAAVPDALVHSAHDWPAALGLA